eukprot:1186040-Prorocentrum_minimum.AAC.5
MATLASDNGPIDSAGVHSRGSKPRRKYPKKHQRSTIKPCCESYLALSHALAVVEAVRELLPDASGRARRDMLDQYAHLKDALGAPGVAKRAASLIVELAARPS